MNDHRTYPRPDHQRRIPLAHCPTGNPDDDHRMLVMFTYLREDPLVVTAWIPRGRALERWDLSRDLIVEGLGAPAGHGNVRIEPEPCYGPGCAGAVRLLLSAEGYGVEVFMAARGSLARFVDETFDVVPAGSEFDALSLDDVDVIALLGGAA